MTAKVVKRKRGEEAWTEVEFPRATAFRSKYVTPTLRATKYGLVFYCTDLVDGQVKIFSNGSKVAIVPDAEGPKRLKQDKRSRKLTIGGKKTTEQVGLTIGQTLAGTKGEIMGQQGWVFE